MYIPTTINHLQVLSVLSFEAEAQAVSGSELLDEIVDNALENQYSNPAAICPVTQSRLSDNIKQARIVVGDILQSVNGEEPVTDAPLFRMTSQQRNARRKYRQVSKQIAKKALKLHETGATLTPAQVQQLHRVNALVTCSPLPQ